MAGTYNVTLTVTNDRGVAASTTQAVVVGAGALPIALFSFSPSAPGAGQEILFNASASTAGLGHTISQYSWVFGDGDSKTGMIVQHDFSASGSYNVTLAVTDESGQKGFATIAVSVAAANVTTPKALFTYSPASPVAAPATVTVNGSASTAPNGATIVAYSWNFGDGSPTAIVVTSASSTTHQYTVPGTYTITLTVTDGLGATNATTRPITVN